MKHEIVIIFSGCLCMGASMALLIPTRPTESFLAGVGFFVGGALQHYLRRDQ